MADPWRYRCPKGHSNIERHTAENAHRCNSCHVVYAGAPVDAKEVDGFPVEREIIREKKEIGPKTVLESLLEIADDPVRNWIQTREIAADVGADPRQIGQILSHLEDDGRVERLPDKTHPCWSVAGDARATADPRTIGLLVLVIGLVATIVAGGVTAI
ncbi:hypothetical protein HALLA_12255 [Halostagnicola larsenii XH-48]|uniref:Uncharacterized protein n=1 Tax=Halostagnicola larsenii XH-48 TaxID=797299 RepID=W0JQW3_9EURY|nr:hypothetical protein [Halostagnicola larsenii]AHG00942.1 hypothetical protein HALLA_11940 [Halostagnicola larsenii XH-48]AHG00994.1 hypothetical protein HALLA_12255 [Halostagnicola larsenii XH-48]